MQEKNISSFIKDIETKEDFINFVNLLKNDFIKNKNNWENITLFDYLNAIEAWTKDMEGYYKNTNQYIPKNIPWKIFADILYAGTIYE